MLELALVTLTAADVTAPKCADHVVALAKRLLAHRYAPPYPLPVRHGDLCRSRGKPSDVKLMAATAAALAASAPLAVSSSPSATSVSSSPVSLGATGAATATATVTGTALSQALNDVKRRLDAL